MQLKKLDLQQAKWSVIFKRFRGDTTLLSQFIKLAGEQHNVYLDLDATLRKLGDSCKTRVDFDPQKNKVEIH